MKTISQLILHLEKLRAEHGDINCVISEADDYWGSVQSHIENHNVVVSEHAQPDGPKSGKSEKAVVFSYSSF